MTWGPQSAHIEPQVWILLFSEWRLTHLSPALTLLPWLALGWILVSTHCALGPQGLTLTVPLPCSLQEQLTSKAGLYSPAFPGQGYLTSALRLLTSLSSVLCHPPFFFYKLKLLWVTLCQSFYFKIQSLVKAGGKLIDWHTNKRASVK